jgi:LuxR family maltose regulon positive regulatory protein
MQGYEDTSAFIEAFAGNNHYIMDYLIEEVLKSQSDDPGGYAELVSITCWR